jgi:cobalamin biosynthesis protein CbiG
LLPGEVEEAGEVFRAHEGPSTREATPGPAVCEPAALLAAGLDSQLLVPKTRTRRVTVAIAKAAS